MPQQRTARCCCLQLLALVLLLAQHNLLTAAAEAAPPPGPPAAAPPRLRELPTQAAKPTIVAVGDGLTEGAFARKHDGWGLLLQEHYVRKADVVNRGFGGYFTSWLADYLLDELFAVANPTMAVLFLGTKDTLTPAVSGSHYISPEQFSANVERIIVKAKEAGVRHFLIVTPPPVCEACKQGKPKPWDRENAHSRLYVEQLRALAARHSAGFLNIFDEWQQDPGWADKLLQPDKLHLSSQGNQLLFKQMLGAIEGQVPGMAWASVPVHYPLMDAIDKDDPGAAFGKVQHGAVVKALRDNSSSSSGSSRSIKLGGDGRATSSSSQGDALTLAPEQGKLQQQQQQSAARGLAQGASWMLLGVAVTMWQLFHVL